jgi:hypothetical protein
MAYRPDPVLSGNEFKGRRQMIRKSTKLIHEGKYAAEIVIELLYDDERWSPTMSSTTLENWKPCGWPCAVAILPKQPDTVRCSN